MTLIEWSRRIFISPTRMLQLVWLRQPIFLLIFSFPLFVIHFATSDTDFIFLIFSTDVAILDLPVMRQQMLRNIISILIKGLLVHI